MAGRNYQKDITNVYSPGISLDMATDREASMTAAGRTRTAADRTRTAADRTRTDELLDLWFEFLRETSCHGMKNIRSPTRPKAVRSLYGIVVLGALMGLLFTVFKLLSRVANYNTVTRTEIYVDPNMTFPTVTLCNVCQYSFRGKNASDPLYRLLVKSSTYGDLLPANNHSQPPFTHFLQRSTEDVFREYLMDLDIKHAKYDGSRLQLHNFDTLDTQYGRCRQFNEHNYKSKHRTWQPQKRAGKSGLTILVKIQQDDYIVGDRAGLRVYISQSSDFAAVDSRGIVVMPGTSTGISVKPHKISFLPRPYTSFGSDYCTDADPSGQKLVAKMVNSTFYSFEKCQSQCVAYKASMECQCHTPLLVIPGLKTCTMDQYLFGCYFQASERIHLEVSSHCDCPRSCSFVQYDLTLSASQFPSSVDRDAIMTYFNITDKNTLKDNFLEVQVHFDSPLVWMEKHDPEYTIHSFMSSLGGQLGICLGASVITLLEFWELILRTVVVSCRRLRRSSPDKAVTTKVSL